MKKVFLIVTLLLLTAAAECKDYKWPHWVMMTTSLSDICNNWLHTYPSIFQDNIHDLDGYNGQGADGIVNFIDFACFAKAYEENW